jgi:hypothetical protein
MAERIAHYHLPSEELDRLYPYPRPPKRSLLVRAFGSLWSGVLWIVMLVVVLLVLNYLNSGDWLAGH